MSLPDKIEPRLRVGFLLAPQFTLTAFAGFVDILRLAADDGDRSRARLVQWAILDAAEGPVASSCCAKVTPTAPLEAPQQYDYLVVVGGLLQGKPRLPSRWLGFLREADRAGVKLVGLCTGSFLLAEAGLLDGHLSCVSWFHREDFAARYPACRIVSSQMFVVDGPRLTCAGGTSVVHLAAHIVERHLDRTTAVKALRIMLEQQPLPSRTLQPEQVVSVQSSDSVVHKAMLMLEQHLHSREPIDELCEPLGLCRRQLDRRFLQDIGLSPVEYRTRLRLERARWLLQSTDLDVIDIGFECGFNDGAAFSRFVRKGLGQSPRAYRHAARAPRAAS